MRNFEEGDLVKWKTSWGMTYATIIEKIRTPLAEEEWIYTMLWDGQIIKTGLRSYMTLIDEPHEATLYQYRAQLLREQESC